MMHVTFFCNLAADSLLIVHRNLDPKGFSKLNTVTPQQFALIVMKLEYLVKTIVQCLLFFPFTPYDNTLIAFRGQPKMT